MKENKKYLEVIMTPESEPVSEESEESNESSEQVENPL
jgi:hypothetical protein